MAIPAALAAIGKWALANPQYSIPIGTTLVSGLKRLISPDRQRELQMDVLNSQTRFRDVLARRAFGNFTAAERQQIAAAAEPQVNQVAANVSRRGLGGSGAGLQVISQAQQRPFEVAQRQALQALPSVNASVLDASRLLMDDGGFLRELGALAQELALASEAGDDMSELKELITILYQNAGSPTPGSTTTTQAIPDFGSSGRTYQGWQGYLGG